MRQVMAYDKLARERPRLLVLESQYWLDSACANAARTMAWDIRTVPVAAEGVLPRASVAELLQTLIDFRPDFLLSINLSGMDVGGLFARLFEDLRMPYVTWFIDDPRTIIMDRTSYASSHTIAVTWEKSYVQYLSDVGFPVVRHLPLAVDATVFNAETPDAWDFGPAFVGNSMIEFAEQEWAWLDRRPELAAAIREALDAQRVTRHTFAKGLRAVLDPDLLGRLDEDERRHAELLLFVEGTRRVRHDLFRVLEPEGVQIHGDEGWQRAFPNAQGPVNYTHALPGFYRACAINLNTTSIQMASAVNQRVFDCPAAGGFLLTDHQAGLANLFDVEHEVACYGSPEKALEMLRWFRTRPAARRDIATRARTRVLGEHTYRHRLETIADLVKQHFCA